MHCSNCDSRLECPECPPSNITLILAWIDLFLTISGTFAAFFLGVCFAKYLLP